MSQSSIMDALTVAADAQRDGDYVTAQRSVDGIGGDFEIVPFSLVKARALLAEANAVKLCDPRIPYEGPSPFVNLQHGMVAVRAAYQYAEKHGAPQEILDRLVRWIGDATQMLGGGDAIEVRIRSYATVVEPQWCGVVGI